MLNRKGTAYSVRGTGYRVGFTLAELMVSVAILMIISLSVMGDITRTRYQEELNSSARSLMGSLRDIQSRALAASSVKLCTPSAGVTAVCDFNLAKCGTASCNQSSSPAVYGVTLVSAATQYTTFADVNGTSNYREDLAGNETLQTIPFAKSNSTSPSFVSIISETADGVGVTSSTVTFDRQRGSMRINACLGGSCVPAEAQALSITLRHSKTSKTKVIYLNAVTGKVEIQ